MGGFKAFSDEFRPLNSARFASKFRSEFMFTAPVIFCLVLIVGLIVIGGILMTQVKRREGAYKSSLESNQKRLDAQVSRVGLLTKALPSLQEVILSQNPTEDWKVMCLEEMRTILRVDSVTYWRFLEREQQLELDVTRGRTQQDKSPVRVGLNTEPFVDALRDKLPSLNVVAHVPSFKSTLVMPLFVESTLRGVFVLEKIGDEQLSRRDADLVGLFITQLALGLQNREMTDNRARYYLEIVQALADLVDSRDALSQGQTRRVRALARSVAKAMELPDEFIYYLEFAALIHDIGNIAIDEQLLKKPGKLTPEEFEIIKKHPELGHKILSSVSMLAPVAPMVLYHQEWFNGKGYPAGLKGEEIPLGARIVGLLDAWNAMTSPRPWRKAMTNEDSIVELKKGAGTQFDPQVVEAFVTVIQSHPST
jgi:HD-GYP domain-containing protein (c-di-GMP phosphodiesterase class II)